MALPAGDYAVANAEARIAVVERKTLENFTTSLSDGTLAFQMQRLGEVARAAVVVEGRFSALFASSTFPPRSSPMGLLAYRCATPRSRWSSRILESSQGNGPIDSSLRPSLIPWARASPGEAAATVAIVLDPFTEGNPDGSFPAECSIPKPPRRSRGLPSSSSGSGPG